MPGVSVEDRAVIYAPTGKDAKLIAQVLEHTGVKTFVCARVGEVVDQLREGVGVLILADEALNTELLNPLALFLDQQPTWSDLPILLMSQRGRGVPEIAHIFPQLGNVTLLERPLQSVTIISATTSALRARRRQYAMREVDRRKDEFLAMLAHELRNPLAPVSAASDLLKIPNLDRGKIKHTSDIISRQVKHMTGLIDDLLDVSRVSRGLVSLDNAVIDARQIVTSAIEQVRPLIDSKRHLLTLRTSPEPAYITGDQKRLVQILSNVLNNASKYTPEGGEIVMSTEVDAANVKFIVADNGMGIEPHIIDSIFDMFAQAERTSDRTQGGLGIGLALVKNLVQLHGGRVFATSEGVGTGSRLEIVLPRTSQADVCLPVIEARIVELPSTRRLLVVDDNVDAATMLGMFLESSGYEVQIVHNAIVALELVRTSESLDACLLDIGLPDMDGNELAKRLRKLPATASAMLIAITGYGQETDRLKTRESGFDYHYVKPVDMTKLANTLAALH